MHRCQYEELKGLIGDYFHELSPVQPAVRVSPIGGPHGGKPGAVVGNEYGTLTVRLASRDLKFPYTKVNLLDADGQPVIPAVLDMTGRPIAEGAVICYSSSCGPKHACEIGKVLRINPVGTVAARPMIHNGARIDPSRYRAERPKNLTSNRTLLLPVELNMVTMWLLSGFEVFNAADMGMF